MLWSIGGINLFPIWRAYAHICQALSERTQFNLDEAKGFVSIQDMKPLRRSLLLQSSPLDVFGVKVGVGKFFCRGQD